MSVFTYWLFELLFEAAFSVLQILWELVRLVWDAVRQKRGVSRADMKLRQRQREERKRAREQRMKEWKDAEEPPTSSPFGGKEPDSSLPQVPRSSSPFSDTI